MHKLILTVLVSLVLMPAARSEEARVILEYQRSGGFVGFNDSFKVYHDFRWSLKGKLQSGKGKLSAEQRQKVTALLAGFKQLHHERSDGPRVADGMQESVDASGTGKGKASKEQREAALAAARSLLAEVSRSLAGT